jgi:biopolymer transport protein ExbD
LRRFGKPIRLLRPARRATVSCHCRVKQPCWCAASQGYRSRGPSHGSPRTRWSYLLTFLMVWMSWVVGTSLGRVSRHGLRVHLIRPGVTAPRSPGIQPLLVQVVGDWRSGRPSLYIDSNRVAGEDLDTVLHKEMSRRPPDWPVYVEGDPDLEWRQVVEAIDAIRGAPAESSFSIGQKAPTELLRRRRDAV